MTDAALPAGPADGPLAWLDDRFLGELASAVTGTDLGDPALGGSVAVVVAAGTGRPRRSRSAAPGASASPTPAGPTAVQGGLVVDAGRVVAWRAGDVPDPVAVLTLPAADARAVLEGRVEPSVLFMQGRLKVDGDMRLVLAVLRSTTTPGYDGRRRMLAEVSSLPASS